MRRICLGLLAALPALAQGYVAAGLDLSRVQTITGAVTAVHMAYGIQYPSITVNQVTIKTAPVWYFENHDFELQIGDEVRVVAAPSSKAGDPYWYALEITKTSTGEVLPLRDGSGVPLWAGGRQGGPARAR